MTVATFQDDETGYRNWIAIHDDGFVINIRRSLNPVNARLHRASCRSINGKPPRGDTWTGPYIKVCAAMKADLDQWADQHAGEIQRCRICHP